MAEKKDTKVEKEVKKTAKVKQSTKAKEKDVKIEKEVKKEVAEASPEKKVVTKVKKKDIAIANGFGLKISPKQSKYICKIIKGKSPEMAVARLQAVIDEKRPVPMAALEIGHRKGKGLAGGRFPKNACRGIMEVVKQAGANAVVNGIEAPVIRIAKADRAAAPYRKAGRKAKRAHIYIEVVEKSKLLRKKK
jgi:ribosomal protein L22